MEKLFEYKFYKKRYRRKWYWVFIVVNINEKLFKEPISIIRLKDNYTLTFDKNCFGKTNFFVDKIKVYPQLTKMEDTNLVSLIDEEKFHRTLLQGFEKHLQNNIKVIKS
jgi:hypothetical protein